MHTDFYAFHALEILKHLKFALFGLLSHVFLGLKVMFFNTSIKT